MVVIRRLTFAILLLALASVFAAPGYGQLLGTACEPYGSVTIRGVPAPDNLSVIATINGMEFARGVTLGGQYILTIPKDNPDTPAKEGWSEGDVIIIRVGSEPATPSFPAISGRIRVDLVVGALSVRMDTWGKIKALFK